jgi:hypothetical protein
MLTRRDPGYLENPLRREMFRAAIARLRLTPVMFELGARPHARRELYRAYPAQTDVFVSRYRPELDEPERAPRCGTCATWRRAIR